MNGGKRHIVVDTKNMPVMIMVTPVDMTDRDAARGLLWCLRLTQPQITQVWADGPYAGQLVDWAQDFLKITLRIFPRPRERRASSSFHGAGALSGPSAGS
ncbi:hypothetical protein ACIRS3_28490 [Streptomyces virginiae]|uniref:hypothetical protein n=1 Tax=Streptomyces virginiae TaxID=1961 RepID=UPI00382A1D34